jgi:hypothetical protein
MKAQPQPVAVFAEADYCYGTGPLTMRVEQIDRAAPVWYDGEKWYRVDGVEIDRSGNEFGRRQVLVRGSRLPASLAPPR